MRRGIVGATFRQCQRFGVRMLRAAASTAPQHVYCPVRLAPRRRPERRKPTLPVTRCGRKLVAGGQSTAPVWFPLPAAHRPRAPVSGSRALLPDRLFAEAPRADRVARESAGWLPALLVAGEHAGREREHPPRAGRHSCGPGRGGSSPPSTRETPGSPVPPDTPPLGAREWSIPARPPTTSTAPAPGSPESPPPVSIPSLPRRTSVVWSTSSTTSGSGSAST